MDLSAISFQDITLTVACLIAVGFLWRDNLKLREALKLEIEDHKKTLRDFNTGKVYDLTARVMVIEDKQGIDRQDRFKYYPPSNAKERAALDNLDMTPAHEYSDAASERDKR